MNPFAIIEQFEKAICDYTGAPYAVAVNSCTNALFLTLQWMPTIELITIPKKTYVSVPMQIWHATGHVAFEDMEWEGIHPLIGTPILDSARRFTSNMFRPGTFMCCSFEYTKPLAIGGGGAILHDNQEADEWLRRARCDGRLQGDFTGDAKMIGWRCRIAPEDAAAGLIRIWKLPRDNPDAPKPDYPD